MKQTKIYKKLLTACLFTTALITAPALARDTTMLKFNGGTVATAEVGGLNYVPQTTWAVHEKTRIIIPIWLVRAEDGSLLPMEERFSFGYEGWYGGPDDDKNSWVPPGNSQWMGDGYAQRKQFMPPDVPGDYGNTNGTGEKKAYINFIDDPYLTVNSERKRLSQWSFPIDVARGTLVKLDGINPFFVSGGGGTFLFKEDAFLGSMQAEYLFSETGNYKLRIVDGVNSAQELHLPIIFTEVQYTITATAGANGSISPSGSVPVKKDESQTFTATPNNWMQVDEWQLNGATVQTGGTSYTVSNVQAAASVHVSFKPQTHTLTAYAGVGGSISPEGAVVVNKGGSQTFTASPNSGKEVDVWRLNSAVVQTGGTSYTVNSVQANATVEVAFKDIRYTLSFDADGGSPTPPAQSVKTGDKATEPEAPTKEGYEFAGWYNGEAKWDFATDAVSENLTLKAKWVLENPFPIFDGLAGEYLQSSTPVVLKVKGKDSEKFILFTVNGEPAQEFVPSTKGSFLIEASTMDYGIARIRTYVTVK